MKKTAMDKRGFLPSVTLLFSCVQTMKIAAKQTLLQDNVINLV